MSGEPFLVLDRLVKSFGGGSGAAGAARGAPAAARPVLDGLSLAVGRGEVVALLGPSGSGKTTALRLVAGFETPDAGGGRVLVEGQDVTALPPARRRFGMVFQHYALFPHLTVGENVAFGLEGQRPGRDPLRARVAAALALVDLPGYESRRIGEISGGQQQRVALARALAPEPRVLLLDEPLSNLDPALRERTRRELARAVRRVGITTLLVTHEQDEAFHLADRVAVLQGGVLHQVGTPEELYDRPATRFVATFVGRASVLPGTFQGQGTAGQVRLFAAAGGGAGARARAGAEAGAGETAGGAAGAGAGAEGGVAGGAAGAGAGAEGEAAGGAAAGDGVAWPGTAAEPLAAGEPVELVVRPEALALVPAGTAGALAGRVVERRYAGAVTFYVVELAGREAAGGGPASAGAAMAGAAAPAAGAAAGDATGAAAADATAAAEIEVAAGPAAAVPGDLVAVAPAGPAGTAGGRIFRRPGRPA